LIGTESLLATSNFIPVPFYYTIMLPYLEKATTSSNISHSNQALRPACYMHNVGH
jgi:hypothetical protein